MGDSKKESHLPSHPFSGAKMFSFQGGLYQGPVMIRSVFFLDIFQTCLPKPEVGQWTCRYFRRRFKLFEKETDRCLRLSVLGTLNTPKQKRYVPGRYWSVTQVGESTWYIPMWRRNEPHLVPWNLTNVPWTSMVGRCTSYWNGPFLKQKSVYLAFSSKDYKNQASWVHLCPPKVW